MEMYKRSDAMYFSLLTQDIGRMENSIWFSIRAQTVPGPMLKAKSEDDIE